MTSSAQLLFFGIGLGMAFVVARIAKTKGYSETAWWFGGLLLWPVALLWLLALPKNPKRFRRCPDCGSTDVPSDVPVCRHCGRDERTAASA